LSLPLRRSKEFVLPRSASVGSPRLALLLHMPSFVGYKHKSVLSLPRLYAPSSVALMISKSSRLLSVVRKKKVVLLRLLRSQPLQSLLPLC
jgi:hypothetical protein